MALDIEYLEQLLYNAEADYLNSPTQQKIDIIEMLKTAIISGAGNADVSIRRAFNNSIRESFDALESSDGATVTMSLERAGGGDLTLLFDELETVLDCTPACTIELTTGTLSAQVENFIYILESTKVLTKSTVNWPVAPHIKIAYFLVADASEVQGDGGTFINQNWNDHHEGSDNEGHLNHMGKSTRRRGANWFSGIDSNSDGDDDYLDIVDATVYFKSTEGTIMQFHEHIYPTKDTTSDDSIHVVNWFESPFNEINNLYDIVADSTGASIGNNKWFNFVVWGVANKTGQFEPLMLNLPGGFYNSQSGAEADLEGFTDFSMPRQYTKESSTGFLIAKFTVQRTATTWNFGSFIDLRGITPQNATGGGIGGGDLAAIHTNVSAEIDGVSAKVALVDDDIIIIEDSEDTFSKKKVTLANLKTSLGL